MIPVGCVLAGLVLGVGVAYAVPRIGPNDVETLFYIAKSDDRNRVDYGVHLDATCVPVGRDPVFAYWRRFEPGAERFGDLNLLDQTVYGIEHQDVATRDGTGTWIRVQLRALSSRTLHVRIQRGQDGCTGVVLLEILGQDAILSHVFVQLEGPFSIDRLVIRGRGRLSGEPISESMAP